MYLLFSSLYSPYSLFLLFFFFFLMIRRPPRSTLFPTRRSSDLIDRWWGRWTVPFGHALLDVCSVQNPWCAPARSEEHTSELQSRRDLVCRLLLEKKKKKKY